MGTIPDYYATLHVPHDANLQQISRAYRALMRSHHPDLEAGRAYAVQQPAGPAADPPGEGELLQIMQAFAVLRDPARRAAYDRELKAAGARSGPAAGSGTATDIPVRKVRRPAGPSGNTIRITPVHWESGPWA